MPKPKTERNRQILNLVTRGYTLQKVAEQFGLSHQRVSDIVKAQGGSPLYLTKEVLIVYKDADYTIGMIAEETGYSESYISTIAKKCGVHLRNSRSLSKAMCDDIFTLYVKGMSQTEIAAIYDVSQTYISKIVRERFKVL